MMAEKSGGQTSLARKMMYALTGGVAAGIAILLLREHLQASGDTALWQTINSLLFQDITAKGAESALGIFFIIGQLFIKAMQLVIVPMVFTSIALSICQITDATTLGRVSGKTIGWFLIGSLSALFMTSCVGIAAYSAGIFSADIGGLQAKSGATGSNPLIVILNIIPNNLVTTLGSNSSILSVVFLAVGLGLAMNHLGEERSAMLKKLLVEANDAVVVFLTYIIEKFAPLAVFMLLTRTFAIYGVSYLRPAFAYVILTTALLLIFLLVGYPLLIYLGARLNPLPFVKKITEVTVFGFSTSSSAATLPLNMQACTVHLGVDKTISSFVLPLGMTINMDGTAIMQVVATLFIAGCSGYEITFGRLILISLLALIASVGTPAAPGAGAIILFTILSGIGLTSDSAMLAYALILAINRPIEMLVTALNVVGDATTAIIVAASENLLDKEVYAS